ncbi:cold shock and DUF1294 domain-containing protein [Variovorax sp. YR752]|uniref:cold shock and DUF1294 domain-containing protein n=1 Tax=Variovorax sp. YR752 TaxID=1884383 RepID=UPI003137E864
MNKQGTIVRWEADRGFGFVRGPGTESDVFFHIRDFRGGNTTPSEGLEVRYEEIHVGGKGPRAMAVMPLDYVDPRRAPPPESSRRAHGGKRPPPPPHVAAEMRAMLLLVPAYAAALVWAAWTQRLQVPVALAAPLLSVLTFYLYWRDKFAAQRNAWRTPENTLHAASLLGGWPGAWLAQRLLRHKSAKESFRQVYWATVALHWVLLALWLYSTPAR